MSVEKWINLKPKYKPQITLGPFITPSITKIVRSQQEFIKGLIDKAGNYGTCAWFSEYLKLEKYLDDLNEEFNKYNNLSSKKDKLNKKRELALLLSGKYDNKNRGLHVNFFITKLTALTIAAKKIIPLVEKIEGIIKGLGPDDQRYILGGSFFDKLDFLKKRDHFRVRTFEIEKKLREIYDELVDFGFTFSASTDWERWPNFLDNAQEFPDDILKMATQIQNVWGRTVAYMLLDLGKIAKLDVSNLKKLLKNEKKQQEADTKQKAAIKKQLEEAAAEEKRKQEEIKKAEQLRKNQEAAAAKKKAAEEKLKIEKERQAVAAAMLKKKNRQQMLNAWKNLVEDFKKYEKLRTDYLKKVNLSEIKNFGENFKPVIATIGFTAEKFIPYYEGKLKEYVNHFEEAIKKPFDRKIDANIRKAYEDYYKKCGLAFKDFHKKMIPLINILEKYHKETV